MYPSTRTKMKGEQNECKILPRDLNIVWGSDENQWEIKHGEKGEQGYALAKKVMWFEVKATYRGAKAGRKYKVGFNISLDRDAKGWEGSPVFMMTTVGFSDDYTWRKLSLEHKDNLSMDDVIEIPVSARDTTLQFGLYEIWNGKWKNGLRIHHAFVTQL
ncbi:protein PHLOEM PROTEIN 2-LIKE A9-like isoform X2 [Cucurbita moschata]|uniref:Protein PHLOEM PROTEIN 2-LIKE A9-like isoform X2 n=1 Tax=Cucurbita moschata TaxID=3662 RepID=A0A6J1ECM7_CUCMO|nr:protein PHLOEM PROTEIN 2-LIKE A9-like isoform X2 [Cucurbita moschata]